MGEFFGLENSLDELKFVKILFDGLIDYEEILDDEEEQTKASLKDARGGATSFSKTDDVINDRDDVSTPQIRQTRYFRTLQLLPAARPSLRPSSNVGCSPEASLSTAPLQLMSS